ncbi:MAG: hypothetical protein U9Q62_02845 [Campylobacterota bacterium]|nr:hypothetical protein [Campylobacterota bacterium]
MDPTTIAPLNKRTPLLSNLNNLENIALIKEIHEHLATEKAQALAMEAFLRIGYEKIARNRSAECNAEGRFITQLIRATMVQYAKIIITTPFVLLDDAREITFFLDLFAKLNISERVIILDMQTNRLKYEEGGSQCHIVT